jgi:hypothetical protein
VSELYGHEEFPKIRAIRIVRSFSQYGLKDAKEIVEDLLLAGQEAGYALGEHNCYGPLGEYARTGLQGVLGMAISAVTKERKDLLVWFVVLRLRRYTVVGPMSAPVQGESA